MAVGFRASGVVRLFVVLLTVLTVAPQFTATDVSAASGLNWLYGSGSATGGRLIHLRVELTGPAPSGGAVVALSSDNAAIPVPGSVQIAAGETEKTIAVTTVPVRVDTSVRVTASYRGVSKSRSVLIKEPVLSSLYVQSRIRAGGLGRVTVRISGPAPAGGLVLNVRSSRPSVLPLPGDVMFTAGQESATFRVPAKAVSYDIPMNVTARYDGRKIVKPTIVRVYAGSTPTQTSTATESPTSTETPSATATLTETPVPTATNTATPDPTATQTPTETATETAVPTETQSPTATDTPEATATPTETATNTPTLTATNTVAPTDTATATETATNTPVPTDTPTQTATNTPIPTDTATQTATNTPVPTDTPTATYTSTPFPTETASATATLTETPPNETETPTASPTQVPPTNTPTNTPTEIATATLTDTPLPPTATPTPTDTPDPTATLTPTATPSPSSTATQVPPSATPTNTPTATATNTAEPTVTNTPVPTDTPTPSETATSTPSPTITSTPAPPNFSFALDDADWTLTVGQSATFTACWTNPSAAIDLSPTYMYAEKGAGSNQASFELSPNSNFAVEVFISAEQPCDAIEVTGVKAGTAVMVLEYGATPNNKKVYSETITIVDPPTFAGGSLSMLAHWAPISIAPMRLIEDRGFEP